MWRDRLGKDEGMLFVFPLDTEVGFWMRNTPAALDMVFIDSSARVVSVAADAEPYSEEMIRPPVPVRYVLEVRAGLCRQKGISGGERVKLPDLSSLAPR